MKSYWLIIISAVLLIGGLAAGILSLRNPSPEYLSERIADNLARELTILNKDASSVVEEFRSRDTVPLVSSYKYPFFHYQNNELVSWSDNSFVFPGTALTGDFDIKLFKTPDGDFLVKKWTLDNSNFLIAILQLYRKYRIQNSYLSPRWNESIFREQGFIVYDQSAAAGIPVCVNDRCLFKVSYPSGQLPSLKHGGMVAVVFISFGIILLVVFVYRIVGRIRLNAALSFLFLAFSLSAIRVLMILFNFPGVFVEMALFDPMNFASSGINPSLGDLLLNELALLIVCHYLFSNYYRFRILQWMYKRAPLVLSVISSFCVFLGVLYPFIVIQTIYNNSSIVFDISQTLHFDGLRIAAFLGLLLSWCCSFLFTHIFIRLIVSGITTAKALISFMAGGVLFATVNEFTGQQYIEVALVAGLYFFLVYGLKLSRSLRKVSYAAFAYLFAAILCFSLSGMLAIQHFSRLEKIESQFRFANNFLIDRDDFGEYLLHDVVGKISRDAFIQSRIASPFLSKDAVRQKIRQIFLPGYFNKYDVNIFLFSSSGIPIGNHVASSFSELVSSYNEMGGVETQENVFFVNSPSSDISQRYLVIVPIIKSRVTSGYVVLELLLKKVIPENVYPELLVDSRFVQFNRTRDHSFALLTPRGLTLSSGDFNYELFFRREWLGNPDMHQKGVRYAGFDHIAVEDDSGRIAIVSSPAMPFIYRMANFSFLLVTGLALLLILILFLGLFNYFQGTTLFFSARIQLFINLAFFLPLIVVSITTLSLTSLSSLEQLNTEYLNKSRFFASQVGPMLDQRAETAVEERVSIENTLADLAKLSNLDANVYTSDGKLMASSQPLIFDNDLLSSYINPEALRRVRLGENLFVTEEQVGKLNYYVSYATLKSPQRGEITGILAIPFFQSESSLEKIQITILANMLNVFAAFFIVLLVLSYVGSQWLTFPLRFITSSLSRTSLTKVNQPLTWKANDEIGLMVREYNQMLYKLSESKAELEQTQRERAWREIAQQVAHEIKNPLTPMKLTLQQLERSLQSGVEAKDKTSKALSSLLGQIETLDDIASSFSSFAKMPDPEIRRLELNKLLKRIVMLHSQSGSIHFKSAVVEAYAMADEQLLGRVFSNLILNGFQAAVPGVPVHIEVSLEQYEAMFRITFHDNGKGIEKELGDRVFIPHFSTKKSGSGLGLAISRQGIEIMKGKIWFESTPGKGTSFFIELPVA